MADKPGDDAIFVNPSAFLRSNPEVRSGSGLDEFFDLLSLPYLN